jgi:hypothetical protein
LIQRTLTLPELLEFRQSRTSFPIVKEQKELSQRQNLATDPALAGNSDDLSLAKLNIAGYSRNVKPRRLQLSPILN